MRAVPMFRSSSPGRLHLPVLIAPLVGKTRISGSAWQQPTASSCSFKRRFRHGKQQQMFFDVRYFLYVFLGSLDFLFCR
ncbi:unnamed protein product [Ectocarpus sp. 12 AP-2014]